MRYEANGNRVKRGWNIRDKNGRYVGFVVSRDGKSLVALEKATSPLLVRRSCDDGSILLESEPPDGSSSLAESWDGSLLALTGGGLVHFLNASDFSLRHTHDLRLGVCGLHFLKDGDLLCATDAGVVRVRAGTNYPLELRRQLKRPSKKLFILHSALCILQSRLVSNRKCHSHPLQENPPRRGC